VDLIHFLKGPPGLSVKHVIKLIGALLARFPQKPARCKQAVDGLRELGLGPANILAVVRLLDGCIEQEALRPNVELQVAALAGGALRCVPVYGCLGLKPLPTVEELIAECRRQAMAAASSSRCPADSNMVCRMYDLVLRRYFTGYNRPQQAYTRGHVPDEIWSHIPVTINVDAYQFGRGCAEVDCLTQAFDERHSKGVTSTSIKGCVFVAYHPKEQKERPACTGCCRWLGHSEAVFKERA
jgi:hypothetical protein